MDLISQSTDLSKLVGVKVCKSCICKMNFLGVQMDIIITENFLIILVQSIHLWGLYTRLSVKMFAQNMKWEKEKLEVKKNTLLNTSIFSISSVTESYSEKENNTKT